jgi:hypothetical protein
MFRAVVNGVIYIWHFYSIIGVNAISTHSYAVTIITYVDTY